MPVATRRTPITISPSEHEDIDGAMGDGLGDSDIDMEIMDPTPVVRTKTKARAKGKKECNHAGVTRRNQGKPQGGAVFF